MATEERELARDAVRGLEDEASRQLLTYEANLKQLRANMELTSRQVNKHAGKQRHTMPSQLMPPQPYSFALRAWVAGAGALIYL